jgi:hypothetical protein
MRLILINDLYLRILGHSYAKGIVGTAEFTLQGQVKTLYTNHHGWLHGWLRYSLNDATGAADLAHDTCVRLIARPRSFTTGPEAPAYLRTVANGLCIDMGAIARSSGPGIKPGHPASGACTVRRSACRLTHQEAAREWGVSSRMEPF